MLATILEVGVRFELTVLGICSPLHWATLPPDQIGADNEDWTHDLSLTKGVRYHYAISAITVKPLVVR